MILVTVGTLSAKKQTATACPILVDPGASDQPNANHDNHLAARNGEVAATDVIFRQVKSLTVRGNECDIP